MIFIFNKGKRNEKLLVLIPMITTIMFLCSKKMLFAQL